MKYSILFLLPLIGALVSKGQTCFSGHWVNRLPLQVANGDTAQVWQYDCDSMASNIQFISSASFVLVDSAVIIEPIIKSFFHTYVKSVKPREIMIPVTDHWVMDDTITEGGAEYVRHFLNNDTKYDLLCPKLGKGVYLRNIHNGRSLWFRNDIAAVDFYKQIKYLK